jgi:hypothetical protein
LELLDERKKKLVTNKWKSIVEEVEAYVVL